MISCRIWRTACKRANPFMLAPCMPLSCACTILASQQCSQVRASPRCQLVTRGAAGEMRANLAQEVDDADDEGAIGGVNTDDEGIVHDTLACQERRVCPQRFHQSSVRARLHLTRQHPTVEKERPTVINSFSVTSKFSILLKEISERNI